MVKQGANDGKEPAAPSLDDAKRAVSRIMEQKSKISPAPKAAAPAPPAGKTAAAPAAPAPPAGKVAAPAAPAPPASPAAPAPPAPAPAKRDFRAAFAEAQRFVRELCKQKEPEPTPEVDEQD